MLKPALLLVALSAVLYLGLYVMGWWVVRLVRHLVPTAWLPPTALVGLVVLQFVSWYWSTIGWGLDTLWWPLLASSVLAAAVVLRRCGFVGSAPDPTAAVSRSLQHLMTGLGAGALTLFHADEQLSRGTLSIASSNNDAALYALVARHLSAAGLRDAGALAGMDLGNWAAIDYNGAFSFLAFAHWIGNHAMFQIVLPALLVAIVLLAQTVGSLIQSTTALPWHVSGLVVMVALSPYLFILVAWNYFLAQIIGMALCTAILTVMLRLRSPSTPTSPGGTFVVLTVLMAGLVLTYPHMAFLFLPVAGAIVLLADVRQWRRAISAAGAAVGALVVTAAVIPERIVRGVDKLLTLESVVAGWPLPGILPWGLVGFQSSFTDTVSATTLVGSVLVCAVACGAARLARRRGARLAFPVEATMAVVLGSYALFYFARGGPTYEQWKWISFLQPLLILAVLMPLVVVASQGAARRGVAAVVAMSLVGLFVVVTRRSEPVSAQMNTSAIYVPYELGHLGSAPGLADVEALNVSLLPYWESMWAVVALWPRTSYLLSDTYFPKSAPTAEWTLVHTADIPRPEPDQLMRNVNGHYTLVRAPDGADSTDAELLDAEIATSLDRVAGDDGVLSGVVTVANTGSSYWIGTGAPIGGVSIGVQLIGEGNQVIGPNFARIPIRSYPFAVTPGDRVTVRFRLPPLEPGDHRLNFFLTAQNVANFGDRSDERVTID